MSDQTNDNSGLERLIAALKDQPNQKAAPVHLWNPPYCGELDMVIDADGNWHYDGTPIGREKLVRLFATVLKREGDDYFLVTPVEKIGIKVEDAPFQAIAMEHNAEGEKQILSFTTNVGDTVIASDEHPLRFECDDQRQEMRPYIMIRAGLEARLSRPVYYELINLAIAQADARATTGEANEPEVPEGIWSAGTFFPFPSTTL